MAAEKRKRRSGKGGIYSYKTNNGVRWWWRVVVPDPEMPDATIRLGQGGYLTMKAADDAMRKAIRDAAEGGRIKVGKTPTVSEQAELWYQNLDRDALSPATIQGYEKIIRNHITPKLGDIRVDALTSTRVNTHYQWLRAEGSRGRKTFGEPLGVNTINKVHIVLGAIIESAVDDEHLVRNPVRHKSVRAPKGSAIRKAKPEIQVWTEDQLSAFLEWNQNIYNDDLFTLWRTLAYTGMRRSEALALRWNDIDFKHMQLAVRRAIDVTARDSVKTTKGDRPRNVELDEGTVEILQAWKKQRGLISLTFVQREAYVFGLLRDNRLREPNELNKRWNQRVARAMQELSGLPWLTIKGLRHTHATILLGRGVPAKVVQERLGHSTIVTTMDTYSHVLPSMQKEAVRAFADALKSS